jgi:hypothetical protein
MVPLALFQEVLGFADILSKPMVCFFVQAN